MASAFGVGRWHGQGRNARGWVRCCGEILSDGPDAKKKRDVFLVVLNDRLAVLCDRRFCLGAVNATPVARSPERDKNASYDEGGKQCEQHEF